MFCTVAEIHAAFKDELKIKASVTLAEHWQTIVVRAHTSGYWDIVNALLKRGYSKAQIDQWDRGEEFEKDLACFWSLARAAGQNPDAFNGEYLAQGKLLDRRPELAEVVFTIGGVLVHPDGTYGQVTTGPFDTGEDSFVPDLDDPRRGEVTRF